MFSYYVSSLTMTGRVEVGEQGTIYDTPPCWKSFKFQQFYRLLNWLRLKFGTELKVVKLAEVKREEAKYGN